jgi:regulator of sigma E protease
MFMNTVISFVIVLGLLIFVHEFGHFLWAKIFRVKVLKFSLGFGPKLFSRQYGDTEYLLSAFPLGGYVKMYGETLGEEEIPAYEQSRSFSHKPVWQRFIIVAGGPLFNLIFAAFLFFLIFYIAGFPQPIESTKIGQVSPGSPAEAAGMIAGDMIVSINGTETTKWEEVSGLIMNSGGQPVTLVVQRETAQLDITVEPRLEKDRNIFGEEIGERLMIGISRSDEVFYEKVSLWRAVGAGIEQTWNFIYLTIVGLVKIMQKVIPASEIGGPILIAQLAGQQMEAGWVNFLFFMAVISVNLGILNLLPIPILDGGHLVFFSVEAVLRKPLSMKAMELMQQIGLVLLGSLMVFVFYNDLLRLFS